MLTPGGVPTVFVIVAKWGSDWIQTKTGTHMQTLLKGYPERGREWSLPEKGLPPKNIPVVQAMFSLPQQIYTVVSDGPGFLVKLSPPIINSMAADTTRHLHSSLTLQDCSHGLWGLVRLTDLVTWWIKPALCNLFCNKLKIVSQPFPLLYFHTLWYIDGWIYSLT